MRSKQANPSSRSFARRKNKTEALVCYGLFSRKVCYQRHPKKRSQWALSQLCSNSFGSEQKSCIKDDIFTPPILFHLDLDLFQGAWKPNFHIIINYHTFPAFAGTLKPIDACTSPCKCGKCELADLNQKGWQKARTKCCSSNSMERQEIYPPCLQHFRMLCYCYFYTIV